MDCFSLESLEKFIRKQKMKIITKLEHEELVDEDLTQNCDLLTMVLDYSPKIHHLDKRHKLTEKFKMRDKELNIIPIHSSSKSISLNLERKHSNLSEDPDSSEFTSKPFRKISHCSKIMDSLSENKRKFSEISYQMIKEIADEFLNDVFTNIENLEEQKRINLLKKTNVTKIKKIKENVIRKTVSSFFKSKDIKDLNGTDLNLDDDFLNKIFTVYLKQFPDVTTIINLSIDDENKESTLKDLLKQFLHENILHPKDLNLYFFTEHSKDMISKEKFEINLEMNEINCETKIKDLMMKNLYKLDLLMKKFPDLPNIKCLSYFSGQIREGMSDDIKLNYRNVSNPNSYNPSDYMKEKEKDGENLKKQIESYEYRILSQPEKNIL